MDIKNTASLDFETGSYADLRKTGAARYAEDDTTRMLCAGFYVPYGHNDAVGISRDGAGLHKLCDWISDGGAVSGWNVMFEYWIWNVVLPRQFPHITFPKLSIGQLIDTMAIAAYHGLPLSLEKAAQALGTKAQKDKVGHALMMRMSKPRDRKAGTWWHETDKVKYAALCAYCRLDVITERAILRELPVVPKRERLIWKMDAEISTKGVYLDTDLVLKMKALADAEKARLDALLVQKTNGTVKTVNSVATLTKEINERLAAQGKNPVNSMAKDVLAEWLDNPDTPDDVRELMEIRAEAAKSSTAKLEAMLKTASMRDRRIRGLTQYYGAFRTGRDAGRLIQVQNFPRSSVKDQEGLVRYIKAGGDAEGFEPFFGVTPLTALSSALRGCLSVPKDRRFMAIDFSQIEARVLPWLAGDQDRLDIFRSGKDVYVVSAAGIYEISEGDVTPDKRQIGKVSELALGYGGGVGAFQSMAKIYGLKITDAAAEHIKDVWRHKNAPITAFWYALENAAMEALARPEQTFSVGDHIKFRLHKGNLLINLPAGRWLTLRDAEFGLNKFGNRCVTYMDLDQYTQQWVRADTYGGQLAAFVTQGTARDILKDANLRLHGMAGVDILASVHDETLFEIHKGDWRPIWLNRKFSKVPDWAKGLPIEADGYVGDRFKKG